MVVEMYLFSNIHMTKVKFTNAYCFKKSIIPSKSGFVKVIITIIKVWKFMYHNFIK